MSAKTILGRVVDAVRVQDWTAIAVELVIVVMGVFVGTLVANWNERRLEKNETDRSSTTSSAFLTALGNILRPRAAMPTPRSLDGSGSAHFLTANLW